MHSIPMNKPRLLGRGATGAIYKLSTSIVVKRARSGDDEEADHSNEQKIFQLLKDYPPVPHLVRCYLLRPKDTYLEFVPNDSLAMLLNGYQERGPSGVQVLRVSRNLDPTQIRRWMAQTCQAAEDLADRGVFHSDIRPPNILLDKQWNVVLCDLDRANMRDAELAVLTEPFGRLLNDDEGDGAGTYGTAGFRTEVFALGSLYYTLLRGHEPYETEAWGDEHFKVLGERFQRKEFPPLTNSAEDTIIDKCWNGGYRDLRDLRATFGHTEKPLDLFESGEMLRAREQECEAFIASGIIDTLERF